MIGPIRFVFMILWFAIGLAVIGSLKDLTLIMASKAAKAHYQGGLSFRKFNEMLTR